MDTDSLKQVFADEVTKPLIKILKGQGLTRLAQGKALAQQILTNSGNRVAAYAADVASGALTDKDVKVILTMEGKLLKTLSWESLGLAQDAVEDVRAQTVQLLGNAIQKLVPIALEALSTSLAKGK